MYAARDDPPLPTRRTVKAALPESPPKTPSGTPATHFHMGASGAMKKVDSNFVAQRPHALRQFPQSQLQPRFHRAQRGSRGGCDFALA